MNARVSMGRQAAGGALFVGGSQGFRVLLSIASAIVVARLVSPEQYGVIAMVAPVTAFLLLFQNLGLSHAAIQARTLSDQQSNALFWLNMAASLIILVILLAAAPAVAWFYDDPRVGYVTAATALTVLVNGSAIQHMALLNRELRFKALALSEVASTLVGFIVTVVAALILRNYWALWIGSFVGAIVNSMCIWSASDWRPSLRISFKGSGKMVRFGGSLTGFNLVNFFSRNLDNILIGRIWGPAALGLYDRSYRLMMFPVQNINAPLGRVILPILSRLQDEPDRYRRSFLTTLRLIMMFTTPPIAVAGATSDQLVPFLLGERWAGAAPIFFWLSITGLFQPIGNATGWLFISMGRGKALMQWGLFSSAVIIGAIAFGVGYGPAGVAAAYCAATAMLMPILFPWAARGSGVSARDLYSTCTPPMLTAAMIWVVLSQVPPSISFPLLLAIALPGAYVLSLLLHGGFPGGREAIREMAGLVKATLVRRKSLR